jgi:hypothetical protein
MTGFVREFYRLQGSFGNSQRSCFAHVCLLQVFVVQSRHKVLFLFGLLFTLDLNRRLVESFHQFDDILRTLFRLEQILNGNEERHTLENVLTYDIVK